MDHPPQPRDTLDQMQRSCIPKSQRSDPLGDCPDLDVIEQLEHGSSAVKGLGNSAPARVLAMSIAQEEEFHISSL
jgi:hypothetical protein